MTASGIALGFRGDKCRQCGGTFNWGGDRRKAEHLKDHAHLARCKCPECRTAKSAAASPHG